MLVLVCPGCKRKVGIRDSSVGKNLVCPHCRFAFRVVTRPPASKTKVVLFPKSTGGLRACVAKKKPQPAVAQEPPPTPDTRARTPLARKTAIAPAAKRLPQASEKQAAARGKGDTARKSAIVPAAKSSEMQAAAQAKAGAARKTTIAPAAKRPVAPRPTPRSAPAAVAKPPAVRPTPARSSAGSLGAKRHRYLIVAGPCLFLLGGAIWFLFMRGDPVRAVFPVAGRVTIKDGGPLTGGHVFFFEVEESSPSPDRQRASSKGAIGPDGTYRMGTYKDDDGVPEGKYKVLVVPPRPPNPDQPPPDWPPFSARYARYKDTPLQYTVIRGKNEYPIEVQR